MQVPSLGREDPLEEGMATHSSILAWRMPRTKEPGGLQSMGSHLSGVLGTGLPGLGTEHLPGALCSGTGSPALGLCSP